MIQQRHMALEPALIIESPTAAAGLPVRPNHHSRSIPARARFTNSCLRLTLVTLILGSDATRMD